MMQTLDAMYDIRGLGIGLLGMFSSCLLEVKTGSEEIPVQPFREACTGPICVAGSCVAPNRIDHICVLALSK